MFAPFTHADVEETENILTSDPLPILSKLETSPIALALLYQSEELFATICDDNSFYVSFGSALDRISSRILDIPHVPSSETHVDLSVCKTRDQLAQFVSGEELDTFLRFRDSREEPNDTNQFIASFHCLIVVLTRCVGAAHLTAPEIWTLLQQANCRFDLWLDVANKIWNTASLTLADPQLLSAHMEWQSLSFDEPHFQVLDSMMAAMLDLIRMFAFPGLANLPNEDFMPLVTKWNVRDLVWNVLSQPLWKSAHGTPSSLLSDSGCTATVINLTLKLLRLAHPHMGQDPFCSKPDLPQVALQVYLELRPKVKAANPLDVCGYPITGLTIGGMGNALQLILLFLAEIGQQAAKQFWATADGPREGYVPLYTLVLALVNHPFGFLSALCDDFHAFCLQPRAESVDNQITFQATVFRFVCLLVEEIASLTRTSLLKAAIPLMIPLLKQPAFVLDCLTCCLLPDEFFADALLAVSECKRL